MQSSLSRGASGADKEKARSKIDISDLEEDLLEDVPLGDDDDDIGTLPLCNSNNSQYNMLQMILCAVGLGYEAGEEEDLMLDVLSTEDSTEGIKLLTLPIYSWCVVSSLTTRRGGRGSWRHRRRVLQESHRSIFTSQGSWQSETLALIHS